VVIKIQDENGNLYHEEEKEETKQSNASNKKIN
jgi:hypothetical protein